MSRYLYDDINVIYSELKTTKEGLSLDDAENRLAKYGQNKIVHQIRKNYFLTFFKQFTDMLAVILLVASLFSWLLGSPKDALIIFLIVIVNAFISFVQEYKADRAIEALQKYIPHTATVIRDNDRKTIDVADLVPGDVVVLSEGIKVPADIRIIEAYELNTNDSPVTGESEPQLKTFKKSESPKLSLGDLCGSALMGTEVISGNGIGIVVASGMDTALGKIAKVTLDQKLAKSPLEIETDRIAKTVAKATFFIVILLVGVYSILNGYFNIREAFQFSIGVASSLVPEGLPATVSIALAIGVQRMARRKAAIRRLSAVEALGETNVIVTDKTGTLTKNQMTVKEVYFNHENYHIKGVGYNLGGELTCDGKLCDTKKISKMEELFRAATYANNADIDTKNHSKTEYNGDSTELALLVAAEKAGFDTYEMKKKAIFTEEIPFTSERKFMARTLKQNGTETVFFKGAPNIILKRCKRIQGDKGVRAISAKDTHDIQLKIDEMSNEALRVIAAAYKPKDQTATENNLIFLGLFGIIDPPREDVAETITMAKRAGIRTIMVTGDYGITAAAVAKRIKLNENPIIYTGEDLNEFNDKQLKDILLKSDIIFSRVDPIHKLRIVKLLQDMGNTVAVTGDGVNDAPALKKSDVGVAMGLTGTDVAKEAAEMVSLNDSFSSIVWAVKEGRIVYENIKKVTKFVFTSNIAEFTAVTFGLVLGVSPITAIQILLVDLGAEVFPALALAGDTEEDDVMNRPPRDKRDVLFGKEVIYYILRSGIVMGLLATAAFVLFSYQQGWGIGEKFENQGLYVIATTVTYATMAVCQYVNSFSVRSQKLSILKLLAARRVWISIFISICFIFSMIYLPLLASFSSMAPVAAKTWLQILSLAILYLIYLELMKFFNKEPKKVTKLLAEDLVRAGN